MGAGMHEHLKQIGRRLFQRDLQFAHARGAYAKCVLRLFSSVDRLGILDQVQIIGVTRSSRGIEQSSPGKDDVLRRDRLAVGPLRSAKDETPLQTIGRGGPFHGNAWDGARLCVFGH